MYQYYCLNPIAEVGLGNFSDQYQKAEQLEEAQAVLVRSASMHEMELPENLYAVARAGAGVNNIPLKECAERGIVVFNTPGANANGVKELVIAGMLLASRDIVGGISWVREEKDNPEIQKLAEKKKKQFAGCEISGKKLGIIGLGAIGQLTCRDSPVSHASESLRHGVFALSYRVALPVVGNGTGRARWPRACAKPEVGIGRCVGNAACVG